MSTPQIAPSSPPVEPSQVMTYICGFSSRRQGWMITAMTPVMTPPVLKLMSFGAIFEKSLAGLTMFAATFTDNVATVRAARPNRMTIGLENLPINWTGSQIALPNTTTLPEAMRTAMNGNSVIVVGSAID